MLGALFRALAARKGPPASQVRSPDDSRSVLPRCDATRERTDEDAGFGPGAGAAVEGGAAAAERTSPTPAIATPAWLNLDLDIVIAPPEAVAGRVPAAR